MTAERNLTSLPSGENRSASMGPRLVDRGEETTTVEAGRRYTELQWGRGWLTAESTKETERRNPGNVASMGPRLVDRGEDFVAGGAAPFSQRFNGAAVG